MGTKPTKNEMARVIVQALFNRASLPEATDRRVVRCMQSGTHADLVAQYDVTKCVLGQRAEAK